MGGLIGKLSFDQHEQLARPVLEGMLDAIAHRGAECRGLYVAPGLALGWTGTTEDNLPEGPPAANERNTVHVAADAELVNARDLRAQLERLGHAFHGSTQAELIAHAYEQWADGAVERFRGPFACAIWDEAERRLLLARDHMGIKPLFFAFLHGHGVVFGSEIRALLKDPGVGRDISPHAVDAYLALGYVPAPLTIYRRISKLEPAHRLTVDGRRLRMAQFWDLPVPRAGGDLEEAALGVTARLRAAAAGTTGEPLLYSGGVASGALLAALSPGFSGVPVLVAIEQGDPSHVLRAGDAARELGTRPVTEFAVPAVRDALPLVMGSLDEPVADPAVIAQYAACAAGRAQGTTALTGHGAAALFAGYARHRIERIEGLLRGWLGSSLASVGGHLASILPDSVKGARALAHLALAPADACATKHEYGLFDDEHRHGIYTRSFAWEVRDADPLARHVELYLTRDTADPLDRALYVEARTFLPDSSLALAERAALASGLRLRHPYLDPGVVEYAAALPSALKQQGRHDMFVLRHVLAQHVSASLLPPAPRVPAQRPWLRASLAALVPPVLLSERFDGRGIVSRPALRHLWDEHCQGTRDHSQRFWSLLMLELWLREFIDGDAADRPVEYAILKAA